MTLRNRLIDPFRADGKWPLTAALLIGAAAVLVIGVTTLYPEVGTGKGERIEHLPLPVARGAADAATERGWSNLTTKQQLMLAPLQGMWSSMTPDQQVKWKQLAATAQGQSAKAQLRLRGQMEQWARMSPRQRAQARSAFLQALGKFDRAQRSAHWQAYLSLPAEQRPRGLVAMAEVAESSLVIRAGSGATTVRLRDQIGRLSDGEAPGAPAMVSGPSPGADVAIQPAEPASLPVEALVPGPAIVP